MNTNLTNGPLRDINQQGFPVVTPWGNFESGPQLKVKLQKELIKLSRAKDRNSINKAEALRLTIRTLVHPDLPQIYF